MKFCATFRIDAVDDDGLVTKAAILSASVVDDDHSHEPTSRPRPGDVISVAGDVVSAVSP